MILYKWTSYVQNKRILKEVNEMKKELFRLVSKFNHLSYENAYSETSDHEYMDKLIMDLADIIFNMCEQLGIEAEVEPCMDMEACYPIFIIPEAVRTGEM